MQRPEAWIKVKIKDGREFVCAINRKGDTSSVSIRREPRLERRELLPLYRILWN